MIIGLSPWTPLRPPAPPTSPKSPSLTFFFEALPYKNLLFHSEGNEEDVIMLREGGRRREMSIFRTGWRLPGANRSITTIEEASG